MEIRLNFIDLPYDIQLNGVLINKTGDFLFHYFDNSQMFMRAEIRCSGINRAQNMPFWD